MNPITGSVGVTIVRGRVTHNLDGDSLNLEGFPESIPITWRVRAITWRETIGEDWIGWVELGGSTVGWVR